MLLTIDPHFILEETETDETTKGKKPPDEYDEGKRKKLMKMERLLILMKLVITQLTKF